MTADTSAWATPAAVERPGMLPLPVAVLLGPSVAFAVVALVHVEVEDAEVAWA